MQIVEVKNDIAKISYNSANNHLLPSDFLLIEDNASKFIAQVINIETTEDSVLNNAVIRLCLSIDAEDNLSFYNGYIISKNAKINYISSNEIVDLISDEKNNIYFGNLVNHPDTFVKINNDFVNQNLYIQSDKSEKTEIIVKNLISQLVYNNKKVVVVDFDNQYTDIENATVLKIGKDINLPLNVLALDNIIEKDIEDCLLEDKALIQSIILELREYVQTLPNQFLQFSLFRNVISAQYKENPVSGLMVLRNKLWLYAQNNLFANQFENFSAINDELQDNSCVVIDASSVSEKWQNTLIQMVKDIISDNAYLILNFDGIETSKKLINDIYTKENIIPIFCSSYGNSCRNLLSLLSKNQILCKPSSFIEENVQYVDFLNKLNYEEFIVFGQATLYLPLILSIKQFDSNTFEAVVDNDIKRDVDRLFTGTSSVTPVTQTVEEIQKEEILQNSLLRDDDVNEKVDFVPLDEQDVEQILFDDEANDEITLLETSFVQDVEEIAEDDIFDDDLDFLDEFNSEDNVEVDKKQEKILDTQNSEIQDLEEFAIDSNDDVLIQEEFEKIEEDLFNDDDDVLVENLENDEENLLIEEDDVLQEVDDVILDDSQEDILNESDDVIEEQQEIEERQEIENLEEKQQEESVEETTDSEEIENFENTETQQDVDDETSDDGSILDQFEDIEEHNNQSDFQKSSANQKNVERETEQVVEPPVVNEDIPTNENQNIEVYESDLQEKLRQDDLPFKVGDKVFHPKHGNGIVQGFTNYSDKILFCQIEFENVGRRILDPRVAQIEKV